MKTKEELKTSIIGTAKTALVFSIAGERQAFISSVHVSVTEKKSEERITFLGQVELNPECRNNVQSVVTNIIDRIMEALHIETKNYEISITNLGASSAKGIGLEVTGYSAELPIFLAMLSASLQIPLSQDRVSTGHLASTKGDIAPVSGIAEKVNACIEEGSIRRFIYPDFVKNQSMNVMTPKESKEARQALDMSRGLIEFRPVKDISQTIEYMFTSEDLVLASLKSGYYDSQETDIISDSPIDRTCSYLLNDNETRFWNSLEKDLMSGEIDKAKLLLELFVQHHIFHKQYPTAFGTRLHHLLLSVPPATKRKKNLSPLIRMKSCIQLSQYSNQRDYPDVLRLFDSAQNDFRKTGFTAEQVDGKKEVSPQEEPDNLLTYFLKELSARNIADQVLIPIDNARASYNMDKVTVENHAEFNEAIVSFYIHLLRHLNQVEGLVKEESFAPEALDLLNRTFATKGGISAAYAEGLNATQGGMKYILDLMTERLKLEEKEKYIRMVFKGIMDPLDFERKVSLMEAFMKKLGNDLPDEIRKKPPEQYATDHEEIIRAYSESLEKVINLLKIL